MSETEPFRCPFCDTDALGVERQCEREGDHIIDIRCERGHVGTVVFTKTVNAAEMIAERTGEPVEKYEADFEEYPIPEPEDLESVSNQ